MQSTRKRSFTFEAMASAAILTLGVTGMAGAQTFVGGGDPPTYDTQPAVTLAAHSGEAGGREVINIINGTGMLSKTTDDAGDPFGKFGLFRYHAGDNPGTVVGSNWARFQFDQPYQITNLWIWNWNELSPGSGNLTRFGWKHLTVEYSLTGGPNASDWTTAFSDVIVPQSDGATGSAADLIAPLGGPEGVLAQYVVLTNIGTGDELTWGGDDGVNDAGLSEVRFEVPEPASLGLLGASAVAGLLRRRRR